MHRRGMLGWDGGGILGVGWDGGWRIGIVGEG